MFFSIPIRIFLYDGCFDLLIACLVGGVGALGLFCGPVDWREFHDVIMFLNMVQ